MRPLDYILIAAIVAIVVLLHAQILQDVKDEYQHVTARIGRSVVVQWAERVRLRYARAIAGAIAGWKSVVASTTPVAPAPAATTTTTSAAATVRPSGNTISTH